MKSTPFSHPYSNADNRGDICHNYHKKNIGSSRQRMLPRGLDPGGCWWWCWRWQGGRLYSQMLGLQIYAGREGWHTYGLFPAEVIDSQMNKKYSPECLKHGQLWFVKDVMGEKGWLERRDFNRVLLWSTYTPHSVQEMQVKSLRYLWNDIWLLLCISSLPCWDHTVWFLAS